MEVAKKFVSVWVAAALSLFLLPLTVKPAEAAQTSDLSTASVAAGQSDDQGSVLTTQKKKKSKKKDIILGMFTQNSDNDTDNIFASYNGRDMYRIASIYKSNPGQPYSENHYSHSNPSIMYHKGFFWALSNENRWDGKFHPVISYSKDLKHWTHPESSELIHGTNNGIKLDKLPTVNGAPKVDFDVVAPEWSKSKNGGIYIVFSAGYYGANHGDATNDQMQVYTVKVSKLSASRTTPMSSGYSFPSGLNFKAKKARKLKFSNYNGADFIDGQIFTDKGKDYLIVKKDGLWNQLYKTSNINKPNKWRLVNPEVTYGYEGASICKVKKKYYLYGDEVRGSTAVGVKLVTSKKLTKKTNWGTPSKVRWYANGKKQINARHGTVITLKAGTKEWKVAYKLLKKKVK